MSTTNLKLKYKIGEPLLFDQAGEIIALDNRVTQLAAENAELRRDRERLRTAVTLLSRTEFGPMCFCDSKTDGQHSTACRNVNAAIAREK